MWEIGRVLSCKALLLLLLFSAGFVFVSSHANMPKQPRLYKKGEQVELKVNSLTSKKNLYPIDYYRFPYCQPLGGPRMEEEYFGEFLAGDRIQSSPYKQYMLQDSYCQQLCISNVGSNMIRGIRNEYHNNWILDGLASASKTEDDTTVTTRYYQGFPMGFIEEDTDLPYIYNHVNIEIMYRRVIEAGKEETFEIVRFTVEPFSVSHDFVPTYDYDEGDGQYSAEIRNPILSCTPNSTTAEHTNYNMLRSQHPQIAVGKVLFTYDVIWIETQNLNWAHRWDIYLTMDGATIINQEFLKLFLVRSIVAMVGVLAIRVTRILRRQRHHRQPLILVQQEQASDPIRAVYWDVFRTPDMAPRMFALCCGAGAQLLCTLVALFAMHHRFNPEHLRASIVEVALAAFALTGFVGGFVSALVLNTFLGEIIDSKDATTLAASLWFPVIVFGVYDFINILTWIHGSSLSVPFLTLHIYFFLWFLVSTPLAMAGSYIGFQQNWLRFPVQPRSLRRQIPSQPLHLKMPFVLILAGVLPFASFFLDFISIMHALWVGIYDTNYTWCMLSFTLVLVQCALITMSLMVSQFQRENHQWWWRSFWIGGSPALYAFAYSLCWDDVGGNIFLFVSYMMLLCLGLFLCMGFVSVLACLVFNVLLFQHLHPLDIDGGEEEEVGYLMIDDPAAERLEEH
jgi:transmembrane 9 superfamily protein 2/4